MRNVEPVCITIIVCVVILTLGGLIFRACDMQQKTFIHCIDAGKDPAACKQATQP